MFMNSCTWEEKDRNNNYMYSVTTGFTLLLKIGASILIFRGTNKYTDYCLVLMRVLVHQTHSVIQYLFVCLFVQFYNKYIIWLFYKNRKIVSFLALKKEQDCESV